MKKKEMLQHWTELKGDMRLAPCPVVYKHEGSTYDEDGLRITGSKQWIDAVLSRMKDLLKYENGSTRLQVVYKQSTDRHTGELLQSYNAYVQVHERGGEAKMMNAFISGAYDRTGAKRNYISEL